MLTKKVGVRGREKKWRVRREGSGQAKKGRNGEAKARDNNKEGGRGGGGK